MAFGARFKLLGACIGRNFLLAAAGGNGRTCVLTVSALGEMCNLLTVSGRLW